MKQNAQNVAGKKLLLNGETSNMPNGKSLLGASTAMNQSPSAPTVNMGNRKRKLSKSQMIELLAQLGFVNKPWGEYPDTWWFNGHPILTLSAIRKPSDIIKACLISWTPEALKFSEMTETERKERVNKVMEGFFNI